MGLFKKNHTYLLVILLNCNLFSQNIDSTEQVKDVLLSYGRIAYDAEYYDVNKDNSFLDHHFNYQPFVNDDNIVNIEFGVIHSFLETGDFLTPNDLTISYQRNFKTQNYKKNGYQGFGTKLKFTLPTGRAEYLSGFDSWTIEPLIGTQWLINKCLIGSSIRYSYSFKALPGKQPRYSFIRLDGFLGYENSHLWCFIEPDYRYIPSLANSHLFINFDFGYKFNKICGVKFSWKPRIIGDQFYSSLFSLGGYMFL